MVGLWVTFGLANAFAPMPTLIGRLRPLGLVAMLATAGLAGWLLAVLTRGRSNARGAANIAVMAGALLLPVAPSVDAQPAQSTYQIDVLTEGLAYPWSLAWLPDGMLVTERPVPDKRAGRDTGGVAGGIPDVYASGQSGLFDVLLSPHLEQDQQSILAMPVAPLALTTRLAKATLGENRLSKWKRYFAYTQQKRRCPLWRPPRVACG